MNKNLFKNVNFSYAPIFIILALQQLFSPFDPSQPDPEFYGNFTQLAIKIIPFIALVYSAIYWHKLTRSFRILYLFFLFFFLLLVFESLYISNSFFNYPHVFVKWVNVFITFAFYLYYRDKADVNWTFIMNLLLIGLIVKIALYPGAFSFSSFLNHERPLHAATSFLLLLPCIYFFNLYIIDLRSISLFKFLILFIFIIYSQHRSVWVAMFVSLLFNIFLIKHTVYHQFKKVALRGVILSLFFISMSVVVLTYLPSASEKIYQEIENILNPQEDTTGSWRIIQMESYWPYVKSHFFSGMRLRGFELSNQFYLPEYSDYVFEDGSGHHFHSFYFDKLFYFGLIGILGFLWLLLSPIIKTISNDKNLSAAEVSFVTFIFGGLISGIANDFHYDFWAFLGITYAFIDQKIKAETNLS